MTEQEEQLPRDQARRKASLTREEAIAEDSQASKAQRTEKRDAEAIGQSARDQVRRKANLVREEAIIEAQEARRLKAKKQPQG
jgi:hypothetical protein